MNKYKKVAVSIAFLTLLMTGGLSNNYANASYEKMDEAVQAKQEAILLTFENDDYDEWREKMKKKQGISKAVSKKDFKQFVEARKAARTGNYDLAIKLSENLENKLKYKTTFLLK